MEAFVRLNLLKGINGPGHGLLRSFGWICVAVFAIAMFATGVANGQLTGKGAISGTVTDNTGAVIAGASISAKNTATGISTTTTTTGTGDYNFSNLDPGIYTVTTTASGFEKLVQMNIHVNAMETQVYKPTLTVGHASVEVTVTAEPPQLETSNATLGATMENETYAELPIEMGAYGQADQRRASDFVYLMPGVQGNVTNGNATTNTGVVNGSGSRGAASAVYIDGVVFVRAGGNGDPRYVWSAMSVDAIDQFQVQTVGYSAIYEGQGIMNYTIKQGGAKQHGSVYEFFRNTALDTWGFWGKAPIIVNGVATTIKPIEHSNEYGINLSGPLVPFGKWKEKLFYYGNYNGFRYSASNPMPLSFPTAAEQSGDFSALLALPTPIKIYDPTSQTACTANNTKNYPCRYQFGYGPGASAGDAGNPQKVGTPNVIPSTQISTIAKNMQALLPNSAIGTSLQNNYMSQNLTALSNWSTTERIDYIMNSRDTLTLVAAIGRQASSNPVGQGTSSGRNTGPVPFNYGQTYAPKTAVGLIEETHVFGPHLVNQAKWGYARYNGPTYNPDQAPAYAASAMGIGGLPTGQAHDTFPIVTFAGSNVPTGWGGTTANATIAENYTALDNLQWTVGKHSFTFGAQIAWMLYNTYSALGDGATAPLTLANAVAETSGLTGTSKTAFSVTSNTGNSYASFLMGEIDKGSFNDYSFHPGYGARFRPISPYVQDNWKVTTKLTVDLGLRYDFYPSVTEVKDNASFFDPTLTNAVTGLSGALNFTGHGTGTCNCDSPADNYKKNFGPRVGLAYQLGSKTVIRSSYGVMFTHGDAVGGLTSTIGTLGYSAALSASSSNSVTTMTNFLAGGSGAIPTYTAAAGAASGNQFGTGYTTNTTSGGKANAYKGSPTSGMTYDDRYLGGRAPEYINWSFGIQRQVTNALTVNATYVGSEGHFLQMDAYTGRGVQSNQLDPKYLSLGTVLTDKGATIATDCTTYSLGCDSVALAQFGNSTVNQALSTFLKPYPFHSISDSFGYIGNANYHSLQVTANMRAWRGLTLNGNYSFSRAIDDGGYFRSGYAIPAGTIANKANLSYKADAMERTVSTSNQPQHLVITGVWDLPFGKSVVNSSYLERAILGGFKFSGIFQAYSGSPLAITEASTQTNPSMNTCSTSCTPPILNPNFSGSARQNGKWGKGATTDNYTTTSYITPSTGSTVDTAAGPFMNPATSILTSYAYKFSDAPRTAPYNLTGPGNYQLDLAMVRSFPLHFTESAKLNFRAEWYNVTNKTFFAVTGTSLQVGNSLFGTVSPNALANRKAAQFTARIQF
jgi:hypothetical protein